MCAASCITSRIHFLLKIKFVNRSGAFSKVGNFQIWLRELPKPSSVRMGVRQKLTPIQNCLQRIKINREKNNKSPGTCDGTRAAFISCFCYRFIVNKHCQAPLRIAWLVQRRIEIQILKSQPKWRMKNDIERLSIRENDLETERNKIRRIDSRNLRAAGCAGRLMADWWHDKEQSGRIIAVTTLHSAVTVRFAIRVAHCTCCRCLAPFSKSIIIIRSHNSAFKRYQF